MLRLFARRHLWLLLAALLMLQGLMLWHHHEHPFHTHAEPPCVIHQLGQMAAGSLLLLLAVPRLWRRLAVVNVAALLLSFMPRRYGHSRAPPACC